MRLLIPIWISICFIAISCSKEPPVHQDVLVDGNTPPPYNGVSSIALNNYIGNLYIDIVGRGPTIEELDAARLALQESNYADDTRSSLILALQDSPEYYKHADVLMRSRVLNGVDSIEIARKIELLETNISNLMLLGDTLTAYVIQQDADALIELSTARADYESGLIEINEYYRRHIWNLFYDMINMGSENFVLSCFENFIYRSPTEVELEAGMMMYDGLGAFLFLQDGDSKTDLVDLVVNSDSFYEGLVIENYQRFLARSPNSVELYNESLELLAGAPISELQERILISEEYAGF